MRKIKNIKTPEEVAIMREAGRLLGIVLEETLQQIKPGITELELDSFADKRILELGGFPGFKKVDGYKHAICVATNDVVVHGIPKNRVLKEGDIIAVDAGVYLNGFHSDMAETVIVTGQRSSIRQAQDDPESIIEGSNVKNQNYGKLYKFLEAGKSSMYAGIQQAIVGNRVGDISKAIQDIVEKQNGFSVVRSLVGHGVGREIHEDPQIPGYLQGKIEKTPELIPGMTIAVEVIYNMGHHDVEYEGSDDWTIVSKDGSLSGVFERTIVITEDGPQLLTRFPDEDLHSAM